MDLVARKRAGHWLAGGAHREGRQQDLAVREVRRGVPGLLQDEQQRLLKEVAAGILMYG